MNEKNIMMIQEIKNKQEWNDFLLAQPTQAGIFLQSWEWLDFQESLDKKTWRLGIRDDETEDKGKLIGLCGLVQHKLSIMTSYVYAPRGPLSDYGLSAERYRLFFESIRDQMRKKFVAQKHIIFWRFEPMANLAPLIRGTHGYGAESMIEANSLQTQHGRYLIGHSSRLVASVQPFQTILMDLSDEEEKLLARMHEKTRYNIRLATKHGVVVKNAESTPENIAIFLRLLRETAKRDNFRSHHEKYYEKMLQFLNGGAMSVCLWLAYSNDEPAAGAMVSYFGDTATYLHGASSYGHRALMAPYLLHWEIMRQAKVDGYKWYDFWGINEKKWPGITRFKRGFDGKEVNYPGTFDLPFSRFWYNLYQLRKFFS